MIDTSVIEKYQGSVNYIFQQTIAGYNITIFSPERRVGVEITGYYPLSMFKVRNQSVFVLFGPCG